MPRPRNTTKKALPEELRAVAEIEDIDSLQEQVDKCYSSQRYEDFQSAVEKIVWRYVKSNITSAVLFWLITMIASMFMQKVFNIF